jgi:hypothetical protein
MTKDKKLKAQELIINSRRVSTVCTIDNNAVTAAIQCKYTSTTGFKSMSKFKRVINYK